MIIMSLTLCSGRVSRDTVYQYEYPCQLMLGRGQCWIILYRIK